PPPPPSSTLFPYTTLFRSQRHELRRQHFGPRGAEEEHRDADDHEDAERRAEQHQRLLLPAAHRLLLRKLRLHRGVDLRECFRLRDRKSTRLNSSHVAISYA